MNHLLKFLALPLLCLIPSCLGPNGQPPLVGYATLAGDGDVRSDTSAFVALGDLKGDAGIFLKGSGFPMTFPLNLDKNEWVAYNRASKETIRGKIGVDPLPPWAVELFRPGELEKLLSRLGAPAQ